MHFSLIISRSSPPLPFRLKRPSCQTTSHSQPASQPSPLPDHPQHQHVRSHMSDLLEWPLFADSARNHKQSPSPHVDEEDSVPRSAHWVPALSFVWSPLKALKHPHSASRRHTDEADGCVTFVLISEYRTCFDNYRKQRSLQKGCERVLEEPIIIALSVLVMATQSRALNLSRKAFQKSLWDNNNVQLHPQR